MPRYENAVIKKGGKPVRINVTLNVFVPLSTAELEWQGVLLPPNNIGLMLGETYSLVLPGFRPARIEITSQAKPTDRSIDFRGLGKFPEPIAAAQTQDSQ